MSAKQRFGLPQRVKHVSLSGSPELAEGDIYAVVTPHPDGDYFDAEILDSKGNCYLRVEGYRTVAIPNAIDAERLKALQLLTSEEATLVA